MAWGMASGSISHVYRPTTLDGVREIFRLAEQSGLTVGFRGGGNSYGDAALNGENILIDFRRMNRILDWDPAGGLSAWSRASPWSSCGSTSSRMAGGHPSPLAPCASPLAVAPP